MCTSGPPNDGTWGICGACVAAGVCSGPVCIVVSVGAAFAENSASSTSALKVCTVLPTTCWPADELVLKTCCNSVLDRVCASIGIDGVQIGVPAADGFT